MKVKKMLLREETEKVLHTKSNGDKLVAASSGDGYTAFTRDNVRIGHISAETDTAAVAEFSKKEPKYESMNEDYLDSAEFRIQRYEDDIPELFHRVHDGYMRGMVNAKAYADVLAKIYSVLEELDYVDESLKEGYMDAHDGMNHVDTLDMMAALRAVVREYGHMELVTPIVCKLHDDDHGRRLELLNKQMDEGFLVPDQIVGDITLDASGQSVGILGGKGGTVQNDNKAVQEDANDEVMDDLDKPVGKEEDIEFVMSEYIPDSLLIEFVKKIEKNKYLVGVEEEVVTVEFDPNWSEYVYTIEGKGPYSHSSYEYISRDIYDFVMANRTDSSADLDEGYGTDEMTEFLNWIQDYKGGCLWDAFTTEFNTDEDPDIDDVLNWPEDFQNDAYYAYIEKDEYDDDFDDLSSFNECSDVKRADALYGVERNESLTEARYTDTNGVMGKSGATYSDADLRKAWDDSKDSDPSMQAYNGDFDAWKKDTIGNMSKNEAFDMSYGPDLSKLSWQVASYLDVDALGEDNWIEFDCDEPRGLMGSKEKTMRFQAVGENAHKYGYLKTAGSKVEVHFRNGSEAVCNNAEEVARFIAGEFGISI